MITTNVSIVIPTYKRNDQLIRLLSSIRNSNYPLSFLNVIVIDNANDPKLSTAIDGILPKVKILPQESNLYSNAARQIGADAAEGEYIFHIDDDNELLPGCIEKLVDTLNKYDDVGMVGPLMLEGDTDRIWCAGAKVTSFGTVPHNYKDKLLQETVLPELIYEVDFFPNACMVRRSVMKKVAMDSKNFPHNWAEIDFGLRIRELGFKNVCVSGAVERHHVGYSGSLTRFNKRTLYDQAKSRILFRKRYLNRPVHWVKFWAIVFPASSLVYVRRILQSDENKFEMIKLYIQGTRDGVRLNLV